MNFVDRKCVPCVCPFNQAKVSQGLIPSQSGRIILFLQAQIPGWVRPHTQPQVPRKTYLCPGGGTVRRRVQLFITDAGGTESGWQHSSYSQRSKAAFSKVIVAHLLVCLFICLPGNSVLTVLVGNVWHPVIRMQPRMLCSTRHCEQRHYEKESFQKLHRLFENQAFPVSPWRLQGSSHRTLIMPPVWRGEKGASPLCTRPQNP